MLQLLALLTMEPPASFEANRVRDEKVKVLESIVPPAVEEVASMAVRGQYGPGEVSGQARARLPRGGGRPGGLAHRDVRRAAAGRVQLALGGRSDLPAHRASAWPAR